MSAIGAALWPKLRVFQVYGANTNVGKTIASAILCKASQERLKLKTHYLKPVSTGPQDEADNGHISKFCHGVETENLFQFSEPVSPHLAARLDGKILGNSEILLKTYQALQRSAHNGTIVSFVETAGGVLSPGPSGDLQADLYRPLRLPVVLVGDHQLGGIATTISAYESLKIRGYDVSGHFIFKEDRYANSEYLSDYFLDRDIPTLSLPPPPTRNEDPKADQNSMSFYYKASSEKSHGFLSQVLSGQEERVTKLQNMAHEAKDCIWYPFTQHKFVKAKDIIAIDSAYGDNFDALAKSSPVASKPLLQPSFDGSASWWTQGLGHGNPKLSLAAAYAAGRYGHVMFAGAVNEPALELAKLLLKKHNNPNLSKVFYSDDGSTGMEVAIKMALRASCLRYGWDHKKDDIKIIGFQGSYHGDTIGVMDSSEPSTYNEKVEWYTPRGVWLDYPKVKMVNGKWRVEFPPGKAFSGIKYQEFSSLDAILDVSSRRRDTIFSTYSIYVSKIIRSYRDRGHKFGALILEPVVLGAGGMIFVDPLFQQALIELIRLIPSIVNTKANPDIVISDPNNPRLPGEGTPWSGLPVVFDEVFTGIHRLGPFNCNSFIQARPDIVVNAKLLTGGLVPLCTTTASESIFNAFLSDNKTDCLLHGHSYTAHAVGCQVAVETLNMLERSKVAERFNPNVESSIRGSAYSMWSEEFLKQVTSLPVVQEAWALGTVLAIKLVDEQGGYASTVADKLQKALLVEEQKFGASIHSRVLGNVIYLMTSLTVEPSTVRGLETKVLERIAETYKNEVFL